MDEFGRKTPKLIREVSLIVVYRQQIPISDSIHQGEGAREKKSRDKINYHSCVNIFGFDIHIIFHL